MLPNMLRRKHAPFLPLPISPNLPTYTAGYIPRNEEEFHEGRLWEDTGYLSIFASPQDSIDELLGQWAESDDEVQS